MSTVYVIYVFQKRNLEKMKSTLLNVDVSALFPYLCSIYVSHDSLVSNSVLSKVQVVYRRAIYGRKEMRERERKRRINEKKKEGSKRIMK